MEDLEEIPRAWAILSWQEMGRLENFSPLDIDDYLRLAEFEKLPLISDQMPMKFSEKARWEKWSGFCAKCRKEIPQSDMRGNIHHPSESHYIMDAIGLCRDCVLLTPFRYRMHRDMSLAGFSRHWEWSSWPAVKRWGFRKKLVLVAIASSIFGLLWAHL